MNKNALLVYNPNNALSARVHEEMRLWLEEKGFNTIQMDPENCTTDRAALEVEFAISLGGDGTFLSCARLLSRNPVPILPVHLGTFGFITEFTHLEWKEALETWLDKRLYVESRVVLIVRIFRNDKELKSFRAINDAVLSSSGISRLVRLSLKLGGYEAGYFRGDGMILSTATGSTAYSMASGGPILVPPMDALVLTPICPFSFSWRPIVIPGRDEVVITVDPNQRSDILLTIDGQESFPLEEGDLVRVSGKAAGVRLIKSNKRAFYEVIRTKLGWSGGPHA